jgi:hypothetical protein
LLKHPNGLRYPQVGGTWIRRESRINLKPEKSL